MAKNKDTARSAPRTATDIEAHPLRQEVTLLPLNVSVCRCWMDIIPTSPPLPVYSSYFPRQANAARRPHCVYSPTRSNATRSAKHHENGPRQAPPSCLAPSLAATCKDAYHLVSHYKPAARWKKAAPKTLAESPNPTGGGCRHERCWVDERCDARWGEVGVSPFFLSLHHDDGHKRRFRHDEYDNSQQKNKVGS